MATLEERFQQGMGIRAKFGGGTPVESTVPNSRDLAPDLHRIAGDNPAGVQLLQHFKLGQDV